MITHLVLKRSVLLPILPFLLGACDHAGPVDPQVDLNVTVAQAKHAQALPFHGNTTGVLTGQFFPAPEGRCPDERPILAEYRGIGTATHLGRFTVVGGECIFFDPGNPAALNTGEGKYRLTAANGDWLDVAYDLPALRFEPPPSPWILWTTSVRVVEGSGRFQGAEFLGVIWAGGYNAMTHETYSALDGRILYDASLRSR